MPKHLFLFEDPFVVINTPAKRTEYLSDTISLSEFERKDEEMLRGVFLKFAADNKLVDISGKDIKHSVISDMGSWTWMVNWMNMRSLVTDAELNNLMSSLHDKSNEPLNQLTDLHLRLGALFDTKLLNTITNRVMSSVQLIPYPNPSAAETPETTWLQIHQTYPFLWLAIFLQTIIRTEVKQL